MNIAIILPTQLFRESQLLDDLGKNDIVVLYEHPLYFSKYTYHKMKLVMHRASMKYYNDFLKNEYKIKTIYLEYKNDINKIKKYKYDNVYIYDPYDSEIMKQFKKFKNLKIYDNEGFICNKEIYEEYLNSSDNNRFIHKSFYIWCRDRFDILMKNNKPVGKKWSFDSENRLSFPDKYKDIYKFKKTDNKYIKEAKKYVDSNFKNNHGNDNYYLPIDFDGAIKHFKKFLKYKLDDFGPYEDAVDKDIIFGNHSVLSPLLNIGLITPKYIVEETVKYYYKNKPKIQSVEGFIRQIFWREYCAFVYVYKEKSFYDNIFDHKKNLTDDWYDGTTPFEYINNIIEKCLEYGYAHHIERLMYLGNMMLLTEIKPTHVYEWFMEMFIDAYPWVMIPNVYGMSQYAGGSIMTKRPYFCSSNYITKMSSYSKKKDVMEKIIIDNEEYEWYEVLDALFYNFVNNNKNILKKNYSTANIVSIWNKKSQNDKKYIIELSKKYFKLY